MIVFHGTMDRYAENIYKNGILLCKSKEFLDFGRGFYTSNDKRLALKTACTVSDKNNAFNNKPANPAIIRFLVDEQKLSCLKIKRFIGQSNKWKRFIINNRLGKKYLDFFKKGEHNIDSQFDIVIGETADGTIDSFVQSIKLGEIPLDSNMYDFAGFQKSLGMQISFHTLAAISCISYLDCSIIKTREE